MIVDFYGESAGGREWMTSREGGQSIDGDLTRFTIRLLLLYRQPSGAARAGASRRTWRSWRSTTAPM